jgi:CHAT domain-containing protein
VNLINSLRLKANLLGEMSRFQEAADSFEQVRALALQEQPVSLDRQAQAANGLGWALRKLDRNAEALVQYELALKLWEQSGDKNRLAAATANGNLGVALSSMGRNKEALPYLERSLATRRELLPAQHDDIANVLQNLAGLHSELDQNAVALRYAREALTMYTALNGEHHSNVLDVRERIASILTDTGQTAEAEKEYVAILALREKQVGPLHRSYLDTLETLASKLRQRGQNQRALAMIDQALATNRAQYGEQHSRVASNLIVRASALEGLGRYAEALSARQNVLAIHERIFGKDSASAARAKAKLGNLYLKLGDPVRAEAELESALVLITKWAGEKAANTASILVESGDVLFRTNRKERALERYQKALAIHLALYGEENIDVAKDLGYIAEYYLEKKDYARALPMLERANQIDSKLLGPMHTNTAASLNNLAANYYASGQEERSLPLVLRAALIAQANGDPKSSATYLMNLARNYAYLEQKPAAIIFGKQAINMLQKIRSQSSAMDSALQKSLLQSNLKSYRYVADLLTQEGRLAEAQEVLSMLKEEEYFEFIRRDASDKPTATLAKITPAEAPWLDRYQQIGSDIARIARELGELRQSGDASSAKIKALEADLAVANSGFDRITGDMFKAFKDNKARQLTSQKIEAQGALQETLGELGEGVTLVQYLVLPSRVGIIVTTSGVQIAREAIVSEEELNQKVAAYREAVFNPKLDPTGLAQELYQLLIAPISKDLLAAKTRVLMLSLDGTLRYLPFAALHDGERFLVEKTQLALYSDAARDKLKDKAQGNLRVWGMGLTKAVPGFSALSGVKTELDAIVSKDGIAGQVHFDEAFTEQTLQTGLAQKFPVLHIASHFKFSAGTESDSFLLLGDGSKLSLKDVRTRVRFAGVDLLTLSACETAFGGGQDANGREIEGFATLAQNRGAKSVLASLWPVSDASTSRLMQTLYRGRDKDKLNKAAALQKAQLSLLKGTGSAQETTGVDEWRSAARAQAPGQKTDSRKMPAYKTNPALPHAHPYYWAPFILMGNWL